MTEPALRFNESIPLDDIIDLLKTHDYFHGVSDATIGEIARLATVTSYDAASVVHQLDDPLTAICFVLRGRALRRVENDA